MQPLRRAGLQLGMLRFLVSFFGQLRAMSLHSDLTDFASCPVMIGKAIAALQALEKAA